MIEVCVHCGVPAVEILDEMVLERVTMHKPTPGPYLVRDCPDGSGRVACLSQGGAG